mgnify:CR=1 FL=1
MGVATFVEFLNPLAFDVTYVDESRIVDRDGAGRLEFPVAVSLDSLVSFIEDVDPIARGINGDVSRRLELAVSVSLRSPGQQESKAVVKLLYAVVPLVYHVNPSVHSIHC